MIDLIAWALITVGIVYGITESGLFAVFRMWLSAFSDWIASLLYCRKCTGFWVAIAVHYAFPWIPGVRPATHFFAGFAGAGLMWLVDAWVKTHASAEDEFTAINAMRHEAAVKRQRSRNGL